MSLCFFGAKNAFWGCVCNAFRSSGNLQFLWKHRKKFPHPTHFTQVLQNKNMILCVLCVNTFWSKTRIILSCYAKLEFEKVDTMIITRNKKLNVQQAEELSVKNCLQPFLVIWDKLYFCVDFGLLNYWSRDYHGTFSSCFWHWVDNQNFLNP